MTTDLLLNDEIDIFEDPKVSRKKMSDYQELKQLYESYPVFIPEAGQILPAKFCGISSGDYLFSFPGLKDNIRIDSRPTESRFIYHLRLGDELEVLITHVNNSDYEIRGSVSQLHEGQAHEEMMSLEQDDPVIAYIRDINPAGYDVDIHHSNVVLPGFMPNTLAGINKLHDPQSILGDKFEVMIESYSEDEGTYIVSRKRYLQLQIPKEAKKLKPGVVYEGHVTGTMPFGVFVEFNGCLTGMIHKANLNEDWQNKINEIEPGFSVEFYIKEVIRDKNKNYKIILTQNLKETLWDTISQGQVIGGEIKDFKRFGALVKLDDETTGLIHTSELEKSTKKLNKGDEIQVKVISLDRNNRKIFLKIN